MLLAIPLFIFMGVMLERSRIAEDLLETMGRLFGSLRGGLGISVVHRRRAARRRQGRGRRHRRDHGADHAADHAAPRLRQAARRRHGRGDRDAGADLSARDRAGAARRPAQTIRIRRRSSRKGNFAPESVSVSDLFAGAIVPGFALVALYILYLDRGREFVLPEDVARGPARSRRAARSRRWRAAWSKCWSRRCC